MAYLSSLLLFSLYCFASDVVELEPVQASYSCDIPALNDLTLCNKNPYCYWNASIGTTGGCADDPCLKVVAAGTDECDLANNVNCDSSTVQLTYDCGGGTGTFCRARSSQATYDYCFWASLRDGPTSASGCPASVCEYTSKQCVRPSSTSLDCQALKSKDDCALVPKCLWRSSCEHDPCFTNSEGEACASYTSPGQTSPDGGAIVAGDCVSYEPYKADGKVAHYCVNKKYNSKPNLCYFLTTGASWSDTDLDYGASGTYPTYPNPTCSGNLTDCDTNPSGACFTKINPKGALAGRYCGDAEHGAASILHIPTLIVFLLVSVFVSMFVL